MIMAFSFTLFLSPNKKLFGEAFICQISPYSTNPLNGLRVCEYTSIYEIERCNEKYNSGIISQKWLTNHFVPNPQIPGISLDTPELLLGDNKNGKEKESASGSILLL